FPREDARQIHLGMKIVGKGILGLQEIHELDHKQRSGTHFQALRIGVFRLCQNRVSPMLEVVGGIYGGKQVPMADVEPAAIALIRYFSRFDVDVVAGLLAKFFLDPVPIEIHVMVAWKDSDPIVGGLKLSECLEYFRVPRKDAIELCERLAFGAP